MNHLVRRLHQRFDAYADLAAVMDDELLTASVDVPKHKTLTEHLWCVVGARESYATAIEQGAWSGFACSIKSPATDEFVLKLDQSSQRIRALLHDMDKWDDQRLELITTLAEHEVMHEGQIIRHMYALGRDLPKSWVWA